MVFVDVGTAILTGDLNRSTSLNGFMDRMANITTVENRQTKMNTGTIYFCTILC